MNLLTGASLLALAKSIYYSIYTSKDSFGQPTLCLKPLQKAKNISTIKAWTSAFLIFVGIYTS